MFLDSQRGAPLGAGDFGAGVLDVGRAVFARDDEMAAECA